YRAGAALSGAGADPGGEGSRDARPWSRRSGHAARARPCRDDRARHRRARHAQAMARLEAHVADYPRDALALSPALGVFGLLGFSGRIDHHEAQLALLLRLAPQWDEDWWFLTYLGWARIETGDVVTGAHEVERALALNPHNAFAAHARAHGYYEAGDAESGAAFIEAWLPGY